VLLLVQQCYVGAVTPGSNAYQNELYHKCIYILSSVNTTVRYIVGRGLRDKKHVIGLTIFTSKQTCKSFAC